MDQIYGKHFSIMDPQNVSTVIYQINRNDTDPRFTLERLKSREEIVGENRKKTFFVDKTQENGNQLIILSFGKDKVVVNSGVLSQDEVKISRKPTPAKYNTLYSEKETEYKEEIAKINDRAQKEGIRLINIPIRHLGTEKSHEVYGRLEKYIEDNGVEMMFQTSVTDLIIENDHIQGVKIKASKDLENEKIEQTEIYADKVVLAVGRKGANWLVDMANKHNINTETGIVDIGVRYELPDEVMKDVNKYMYEAKFIGRVGPFRDKVRTFCQNPSGFVSAEVYDNNLTLVNGHSYKERKSTNTNLAILVSHHFTSPFKRPIEYGRNVAQNLNDLGAGNIVVQRLGDIYRGKRTWDYELERNTVQATLKSAVAGDITFALGYRTMVSILEFIRAVDKIVEGFGAPDNLLYAPEIKFYSNKVVIDKNFETNIKGLYSIGDGGGMTRGLMMASCSGIQMARNL